jgi:hypothetical protein
MNPLFKSILALLIIFVLNACTTGRVMTTTDAEISPLSGQTGVAEGTIVYGLPLTVFDISIDAERVVQKPGPYAAYAEDLLGLKDVARSENEHWSIRNIVVKTHEELDPSQFYVIKASSLFLTNALSLKKVGLILDINPSVYDRAPVSSNLSSKENGPQHVYDLGSDEYFESRNDTLYKLVNVDTSFVRIPYLVEKKQKLPMDQLAEKAATRLMELRDGIHMILTGESNVFPQNEAAINEINRLEKDYLELFTGKTWKERKSFTYQVIPDKDMAGKPVTICAFSEKTGPARPTGRDEKLLQIGFEPEHKTRDLAILAGEQKQQSNKLYYRVPEVVNARILLGNDQVSTSRKLVYQMGQIIQLPANYLITR